MLDFSISKREILAKWGRKRAGTWGNSSSISENIPVSQSTKLLGFSLWSSHIVVIHLFWNSDGFLCSCEEVTFFSTWLLPDYKEYAGILSERMFRRFLDTQKIPLSCFLPEPIHSDHLHTTCCFQSLIFHIIWYQKPPKMHWVTLCYWTALSVPELTETSSCLHTRIKYTHLFKNVLVMFSSFFKHSYFKAMPFWSFF